MRYIRYRTDTGVYYGALRSDGIHRLAGDLFERCTSDLTLDPFREIGVLDDPSHIRILAPCRPSKIVAVGRNYLDHIREGGGDDFTPEPILFIKPSTSVIGPEDPIHAPKFVKRLDYEGELAAVISRTAKNVRACDAKEYILGYTCLNDVTARDLQNSDGQWTRSKGMDTFCPIGPCISDECDPLRAGIRTTLNGGVVQESDASYQHWNIYALIECITAAMTLLPGDIVTTGTPAGIGPMVPGDVVEVSIEGIGTLRNTVV